MKCFNCGNLIPDSSINCPYCNSRIRDGNISSNGNNAFDTTIIPTTPMNTVLPQDKLNSTQIIPGTNTGFINPVNADNNIEQVTIDRSDRVQINLNNNPQGFVPQSARTSQSVNAEIMNKYGSALVEENITKAYGVNNVQGVPNVPNVPNIPNVNGMANDTQVNPNMNSNSGFTDGSFTEIPKNNDNDLEMFVDLDDEPKNVDEPVFNPVNEQKFISPSVEPNVNPRSVEPMVNPNVNINQVIPSNQNFNPGFIPNQNMNNGFIPNQNVSPVSQSIPNGVNVNPTAPIKSTNTVVSVPQNIANNSAPTTQSIENDYNSGVKIGRTAPVRKRKNKFKTVMILLILLVILCGLGVGGYYIYSKIYLNVPKRIDAMVDGLLKELTSINTNKEKIQEKSGTFNASLNIAANDQTYGFDLTGEYKYDLNEEIYFLSTDVSSIKYGDNINLIDSGNDLKTEFYKYKDNEYAYYSNFYDSYIKIENCDDFFVGVSQNDISYNEIVKGFTSAIKYGVKKASYSQSITKKTFNGANDNYSIITFNLNKENVEKIKNGIEESLINNTTFLTNVGYIKAIKADEVKEAITNYFDSLELEEHDGKLMVYTKAWDSSFVGIEYTGTWNGKEVDVLIIPTSSGYTFSVKEDSKTVFDGTYTKTINKAATSNTYTYKLESTLGISDIAYKIDFSIEFEDSVSPSVSRINSKNQINQTMFNQYEYERFQDNLTGFGTFGFKSEVIVEEVKENLNKFHSNLGNNIYNYFSRFIVPNETIYTNNTTDTSENNVNTSETSENTQVETNDNTSDDSTEQ